MRSIGILDCSVSPESVNPEVQFPCGRCGERVQWRMAPGHGEPCKSCGRYVMRVKDLVRPLTDKDDGLAF